MLAKVVGNVWATRKEENLRGLKLLVIQPVNSAGEPAGQELVAGDQIGAGIADIVLVAVGSSARKAVDEQAPVDAMVVGIIDRVETIRQPKESTSD